MTIRVSTNGILEAHSNKHPVPGALFDSRTIFVPFVRRYWVLKMLSGRGTDLDRRRMLSNDSTLSHAANHSPSLYLSVSVLWTVVVLASVLRIHLLEALVVHDRAMNKRPVKRWRHFGWWKCLIDVYTHVYIVSDHCHNTSISHSSILQNNVHKDGRNTR